jgi:hypothetical protein
MPVLTQARLDVKVYTGGYTSGRPASPTYTIIKNPLEGENNVHFEVAELFKDYVEPSFNNDYNTISTGVWVYWEILKTFEDLTTETQVGFGLGLQGYGYFSDGINPELGTGKQMDNAKIYIPEGEHITIPIFKGTGGVTNITSYKNGSVVSSDGYSIIDTPTDEQPSDLIAYFRDNNDIDYAVITKEDSSTETIYVNKICSPKYSPYKVSFLNRYGVVQDLWFFNKRTDSINITKEKYRRNTVGVNANTTPYYALNKATDLILEIKSGKKTTLNTGFVDEEYTETIQQLLLSENVWITEGGQAYPIIPQNQEFAYKNRLNDKLINFSVEFAYAYNESNIIR